jgi:hypothetical protein
MSTPVWREDLGDEAAVPVPLDYLAAHLDPGYECLEGGQRHRAGRYLVAPPPERLVQFGGIDAVQPEQLPRHGDGIALDDRGGISPPPTH